MIWDLDSASASNRRALCDHIVSTLVELDGGDGPKVYDYQAVAESVALLCEQEHPGTLVRDDYLWFAVSHALCSIGRADSAGRLLMAREEPRHLLPLLQVTAGRGALWRLCAAGMLRPGSCLAGNEAGGMWVLDLAPLADAPDMQLDLTLYGLLRGVIRRLAVVWDGSEGRGVLGLTGWAPRGSDDTGWTAWVAFCRQALTHESASRRWRETPRVMRMDLGQDV